MVNGGKTVPLTLVEQMAGVDRSGNGGSRSRAERKGRTEAGYDPAPPPEFPQLRLTLLELATFPPGFVPLFNDPHLKGRALAGYEREALRVRRHLRRVSRDPRWERDLHARKADFMGVVRRVREAVDGSY